MDLATALELAKIEFIKLHLDEITKRAIELMIQKSEAAK